MARIKLKTSGNRALLGAIADRKEGIRQLVEDEVEATLYSIRDKARSRVPRDTGYLANSIRVIEAEGAVQVEANYGPYVEFGTGSAVQIPSGMENYALQFKRPNERDIRVPAQPYLVPSWMEESQELINRLRRALK